MEAMYSPPTETDIDMLARMWLRIACLVKEHFGVSSTNTVEYLGWVQRLIDENPVEDSLEVNQSLGCVFGMVLVDHVDGLDWCAVIDDEGRDLCLRYRESPLSVFPLDMILKRREKKEVFDLTELFLETKRRVEQLVLQTQRIN
jgi:hypothetical protein